MKPGLLATLALINWQFSLAQVGVNQPKPEQTLDVNGKIKVGDDTATPTEGTIRYNSPEKDFEGHDGTEWKSLTETAHGLSNPLAYFGTTVGVAKGDNVDVSFTPWNDGLGFQEVPAGKYFLVTQLAYKDNNFDANDVFVSAYLLVRTTAPSFRATFPMSGLESVLRPIIADRENPLFILRPGERLLLYHVSNSAETFIEVTVRGFLVDDLNF